MNKSHVLYLLEEGKIVGIIVGTVKPDYIQINQVEIKFSHRNNKKGKQILTEYINRVTLKYNINNFKLSNTGGKLSCSLYYKVFTELGYKIVDENKADIDCDSNPHLRMLISKN
jgi:hypothetical protein